MIHGIPYGTDDLYVQNMLTNDPNIDKLLSRLTLEQLLKYFDRLIDKYDDDCYTASCELDRAAYRGSRFITCEDWAKLIQQQILSKEEN